MVDKFLDFRTEYSQLQIDSFIVGRSGKNKYGMFKQACLELKTRHSSIVTALCKLERLKIDYEKSMADETKCEKEKEILCVEHNETLRAGNASIERSKREYYRFLQIASLLDSEEKYTEKTPEEIEQLERDMWVEDIKEKIACELFSSNGALSGNLFNIVQRLPADMREQIKPRLATPDTRKELFNEYANANHYEIPKSLPPVEMKDIKLIDFIENQGECNG